MPSLEQNIRIWKRYDWSRGGDEWSEPWGTSEMMWHRTIFPRIHNYLPAKAILEIAPGFGRCTQYLKDFTDSLWLVDVTQKCLDGCKERFSNDTHITYMKNDGISLEEIPDDMFDFVFSWDSLVHCDSKVIESYLRQLRKKMKHNGVGFFHHSNLGGVSKEEQVHCRGLRSSYMSADIFRSLCSESGLHCRLQELIPWNSGERLTDCISVFTNNENGENESAEYVKNIDFLLEMSQSREIIKNFAFKKAD